MSTSSESSDNSVAVPRPSASLIVVNERNEILLVHRNPKARSFGGMTVSWRQAFSFVFSMFGNIYFSPPKVFPGGNFDKKQDTSLAVTAIRETFEETGLLLVSSSDSSTTTSPDDAQLEDVRHLIHQQKLLWQDFLDSRRLRADVNALLPFTQWITPKGAPR
jgi:ADP-ribose pyrophosphatase YjhB (NUDIX family)